MRGLCRSAGTARSATGQARDKAGDYGESAGRAAADARDTAEQAGRTTARKGAQGTKWAAEQVCLDFLAPISWCRLLWVYLTMPVFACLSLVTQC